jgi:hypothetical protein
MRRAVRSVYRLAPELFDTIRAPISMVQKTHFQTQTSRVVRSAFQSGTCTALKIRWLSEVHDFLGYRKVFAVPLLADLPLRTVSAYLSETARLRNPVSNRDCALEC